MYSLCTYQSSNSFFCINAESFGEWGHNLVEGAFEDRDYVEGTICCWKIMIPTYKCTQQNMFPFQVTSAKPRSRNFKCMFWTYEPRIVFESMWFYKPIPSKFVFIITTWSLLTFYKFISIRNPDGKNW